MVKEAKIVDKALEKLKEYSGFQIEYERGNLNTKPFISINKHRFLIAVKSVISNGNKISAYSQLQANPTKASSPLLIISGYIPVDIAREYTSAGINYLDISGNCNIRYKDMAIVIEGKKKEKVHKVNQSRAFQETGVKIIFHLLNDSSNLNLPYRDLAKIAKVSLGSVSSVIKELTDLSFILETERKRVLKNIPVLLERWVTAYHDVLRPKLVLKKMKYINHEQYLEWERLAIQDADGVVLWGGEPAASLLTHHLSPEQFTIYTNGSWQSLTRELKLVPDDNGNIEVLEMFWTENDKAREKYIVPSLLIYADLMGSRIGRNVETAQLILENELSNIVGSV